MAAVVILVSHEGWSENKQGSYYERRTQMQLPRRADIHIGQPVSAIKFGGRQSSGYGLILQKD